MAELNKVIEKLSNLPTTVYCGFYQLRITHSLRDDVIKLLKEQPQIVRCKDCKWLVDGNTVEGYCDKIYRRVGYYWFCADGKKKEK